MWLGLVLRHPVYRFWVKMPGEAKYKEPGQGRAGGRSPTRNSVGPLGPQEGRPPPPWRGGPHRPCTHDWVRCGERSSGGVSVGDSTAEAFSLSLGSQNWCVIKGLNLALLGLFQSGFEDVSGLAELPWESCSAIDWS